MWRRHLAGGRRPPPQSVSAWQNFLPPSHLLLNAVSYGRPGTRFATLDAAAIEARTANDRKETNGSPVSWEKAWDAVGRPGSSRNGINKQGISEPESPCS